MAKYTVASIGRSSFEEDLPDSILGAEITRHILTFECRSSKNRIKKQEKGTIMKYKLLSKPNQAINEGEIDKSPKEMYTNFEKTRVKHEPYENMVQNINNIVNQLLKQARTDMEGDNFSDYDLEFLLNDSLPRIQDGISYAMSAIEALTSKDDEND